MNTKDFLRLGVPLSDFIKCPHGLLINLLVAASLWSLGASATAFEPPGPEQRRNAIGPTEGLSEVLRRAFEPGNDFKPIPKPGPSDWLANHAESGQTFADFKSSRPNKPDARRNKIYLQPLGDFPSERSPSLNKLRRYAVAFFQIEVAVLPTVPLSAGNFTTRTNATTRNRQILTRDVLRFLQGRLTNDAFCLLAITMEDLYPEPSWNFVFGQASLSQRVGVYSFARYDPTFFHEPRGKDYESLLLRRSCKVLAHETTHMFGVTHCIYFNCLLNGSNHLDEADRRPMDLCPVDLRKLQFSVGFDVTKRYEELTRFYDEAGFDAEARWTRSRLGSN